MKFYKPLDYLYYLVGITYEGFGISDMTYPSLAGLVSAILCGSLSVILYYIFPDFVLNAYITIIVFVAFTIINVIRYNDDSYSLLCDEWEGHISLEKWIYTSFWVVYFGFSIYCLIQIVESQN